MIEILRTGGETPLTEFTRWLRFALALPNVTPDVDAVGVEDRGRGLFAADLVGLAFLGILVSVKKPEDESPEGLILKALALSGQLVQLERDGIGDFIVLAAVELGVGTDFLRRWSNTFAGGRAIERIIAQLDEEIAHDYDQAAMFVGF